MWTIVASQYFFAVQFKYVWGVPLSPYAVKRPGKNRSDSDVDKFDRQNKKKPGDTKIIPLYVIFLYYP